MYFPVVLIQLPNEMEKHPKYFTHELLRNRTVGHRQSLTKEPITYLCLRLNVDPDFGEVYPTFPYKIRSPVQTLFSPTFLNKSYAKMA